MRRPRPTAVRFWAQVNTNGPVPERRPDLGPCWLWMAYTDPDGYGRFRGPTGKVLAHRFAYEQAIGPIPDGLTIDHLCSVRPCVRPDHMEPVSQRDNVLRSDNITAVNARKTHCNNGHPLFGDNLYTSPLGYRRCRTCVRRSPPQPQEVCS